MRTNRRKDITNLTLAFCNFAKAPEKASTASAMASFSCSANIYHHVILFVCLAPVKRMFMGNPCPKTFRCWENI